MDGLALAHYVRHRWPAAAIVVTSGQLRLLPELLPAGALFLSKPYNSEDLPRLFRTMLEAGRAAAATPNRDGNGDGA